MASEPPAAIAVKPGVLERVWTDFSVSRFYAFGLVSSVLAASAFQPLNVIKIQQQALDSTGAGSRLTLTSVARRIVAREGARGLFRGLGTVLVGTIATDLLYCTSFELLLLKSSRAGVSDSQEANHAASGLLAEFASNGVVVPFEVVSQRLMIQSGVAETSPSGAGAVGTGPRFTSGLHVVRTLVAHGGLRELYRGYFVTALTFGFESAVWWYAYAGLRRRLYEARFGSADAARAQDSPAIHALAGLGAGALTALVANPLDVMKTRIQLASTPISPMGKGSLSFAGTLARTVKDQGWRVLTRGTLTKVLYVAPLSAITTTLYEMVKSLAQADAASGEH